LQCCHLQPAQSTGAHRIPIPVPNELLARVKRILSLRGGAIVRHGRPRAGECDAPAPNDVCCKPTVSTVDTLPALPAWVARPTSGVRVLRIVGNLQLSGRAGTTLLAGQHAGCSHRRRGGELRRDQAVSCECLDCLIILSEHRLQNVLAEYALSYFNRSRPHQGIGQRIPVPTDHSPAQFAGSVTAVPVLGGLHHQYCIAA
jgi:hypothetical protein